MHKAEATRVIFCSWFFARDFLKSSTKCGGYTRDNFVDSSKNIQPTEIIAITVDRGKNRPCEKITVEKIARVQ